MKIFNQSALAAVFISCVAPACMAGELAQSVVPIKDDVFNIKVPHTRLVKENVEMLRMNNKYTLNKWYKEIKGLDKQEGPYFDFGGAEEKHVRPAAHHIFALAGSLQFGLYSEKVTGVSKAEATQMLIRLIQSASYRHKVNNKENVRAWGYQWQSAMWAAQIAMGAWMVWDQLAEADQEMVAKMLVTESDRFNKVAPPYYRNAEGEVRFKGDTKAEENAWNASLLALAVVMMPNHPNNAIWAKQNLIYQLSAYSTPEDRVSDRVIDGVVMKDVLTGSNINSDGTAINHGILHPDYMSAIMFNICNVWLNQMAGVKPLESSLHNGDLIYKALTVNEYNGKTMYQPGSDKKASCEIFFPQGNDWGGERQANYWLIDIMADQFGWDKGQRIKAVSWEQARSTEMLRMMNRDTTGQYYQAKAEDGFDSREEWIGQHLMWGYIGHAFAKINKKK